MNNLIKPMYTKKSWGSEIVWAITDHYMAKTVEIEPYKITDLVVYEKKEKHIKVVYGTLSLAIGPCCGDESDLEYFEMPIGWTRHIAPGMMYRYGATDKKVGIEEISSPEMDDAIIITPVDELNFGGSK